MDRHFSPIFMPAALPPGGIPLAPSVPLMARFENASELNRVQQELAALELNRSGDPSVDIEQLLSQYRLTMTQIARTITTNTSNFPVRENLEAEAKILVPTDTPMRNRIPRVPGAGTAALWRTLTSLGGGWGSAVDQPGGNATARVFFGQSGAPSSLDEVYGARTAGYKLLGQMGDITGFAMAAGATFQNQYATKRTNALVNLMLNEEYAIINADSTSTVAPWGDGTNALAFDGLIPGIATANGVPSAQVQTSVGGLTFAHVDGQLNRLWNQGCKNMWMLINVQEAQSISNLSQASGSLHRIIADSRGDAVTRIRVTGYVHQASNEVVPIIVSRFVPAGTMIFGCDNLPDGSPALEMDVLPQVELPQLAPNEAVQGYVVQEVAPTRDAPQTYSFLVSVFEVLKIKSYLHFAKSTGVTAV